MGNNRQKWTTIDKSGQKQTKTADSRQKWAKMGKKAKMGKNGQIGRK